ncbi:Transmembrane emp24 domain-containing protein eca [Fasciolopsis buskii]|uniref:Transmembrane emp24 domain-containing protein eca n=1 Tax=Fasciolopsis buskii TaxID=27845 RepID=A0A8E0S7P2_9TREM|nr:Transmembrane emp24 domain-containing protein eca [Fasciolopsis buski]
MLWSFAFVFLLTWPTEVAPMYFYLTNQKPMCFIEEVPDVTMVKGTYRITGEKGKDYTAESIHVEILDPNNNQVLSRTYTADGYFTFTSHQGGEYRICILAQSKSERSRVHLDFAVGENAINYGEVATKDRLNEFELRIRQLQDQVQSIAKDQNYQRVREEYFRQLSESTGHRVTYWSLGQLILLCSIGFWQMRHLRAFFQAKKLV